MTQRFTILCFITTLFLSGLQSNKAQYIGGHPGGLNWQRLESPYVNIIYPEGLDSTAQRTANIINYIRENHTQSVGPKARKLNIVFQNQTTIPNGYVAMAPFRSEFYLSPFSDPTGLGSLNWTDLLAIHEYRHALQMSNAQSGISSLIYYLQGDQGLSTFQALVLPNWYFEGDAVTSETALTTEGRGRMPAFSLEQRALFAANKNYSYMKARNGSYIDLMPSHYPLGYVMCNYARNKSGNDVWANILRDASRLKGIVYPFSQAIRRHTGMYSGQLYKASYKDFKERNEKEIAKLKTLPTQEIPLEDLRHVNSYLHPNYLSNGNLVCLRTGYDRTSYLAEIDELGNETKLTDVAKFVDSYISAQADKFTWVESESDLRWANRNYTNIVVYNYKTGEKITITSKGKYFSPSLSKDGSKVAAVYVAPDQQYRIHILDAETGEKLQELSNKENAYILYPVWDINDKHLVFAENNKGGLTLVRRGLNAEESEILIPSTNHIFGPVKTYKDGYYFSASFSGIDNIYRIDRQNKELYKLTDERIGAFHPSLSPDGKAIVYNDYTVKGQKLIKLDVKDALNEKYSYSEPKDMAKYNTTAIETEGTDVLSKVPTNEYKTSKYNRLKGALRIHSWGFKNNEFGSSGIEVNSQNFLDNTRVRLGYYTDTKQNRAQWEADIQYGGLFPILEAKLTHGKREYDVSKDLALNFSEQTGMLRMTLPFDFSKGMQHTNLSLSSAVMHYKQMDREQAKVNLANQSFSTYRLEASFSSIKSSSRLSLTPRLGYSLSMNYERSLDEGKAEKLAGASNIYLPGLFRTHSISLTGNYRKEAKNAKARLIDQFMYARGYDYLPNNEAYGIHANYRFPMFYPDFGFGGLFYLKRIHANLFYDYSKLSPEFYAEKTTQSSAGAELSFELSIVNTIPLTIGARNSFLIEKDILNPKRDQKFEIFMSMGF